MERSFCGFKGIFDEIYEKWAMQFVNKTNHFLCFNTNHHTKVLVCYHEIRYHCVSSGISTRTITFYTCRLMFSRTLINSLSWFNVLFHPSCQWKAYPNAFLRRAVPMYVMFINPYSSHPHQKNCPDIYTIHSHFILLKRDPLHLVYQQQPKKTYRISAALQSVPIFLPIFPKISNKPQCRGIEFFVLSNHKTQISTCRKDIPSPRPVKVISKT